MKRILIFTDLDGTLLDHRSYSYLPAMDTLRRLSDLRIPVIINSSKTKSEIRELRTKLGNHDPYIVENSGAVIVPSGCFGEAGSREHTEVFGHPYEEILVILSELKEIEGFSFRGFSNFSDNELAQITGLSMHQAGLAKQRLSTEPILWESSTTDRNEFEKRLQQSGLSLVGGGRFFHVMGRTDKAIGLRWLVKRYHRYWGVEESVSVALGDSPNDEAMLRAADIAVVIKSANKGALKVSGSAKVIYSTKSGPEGWSEAVNGILDHYG